MKTNLYKIFLIIGLILLFYTTFLIQIDKDVMFTNYYPNIGLERKKLGAGNYILSNPIEIYSDQDFLNFGFQGDGTKENPYKIDYLNITRGGLDRGLLVISNTNLHFIVENNYINGLNTSFAGIQLINTTNGIIESNNIKNIEEDGISLSKSSLINLQNNVITKVHVGINFYSETNHITINDNKIFDTLGDAIQLTPSDANYNLIEKNTLEQNGEGGIRIWSNHNQILSNLIIGSHVEGINLDFSAVNNSILNNTIINCYGYGIILGSTLVSETIVKFNVLINNSFIYPQKRLAFDNGENNLFEYNYWDDLAIFDENDDQINDIGYYLDGDSLNVDLKPLIAHNIDLILNFQILYPLGGEKINNSLTISWSKAVDTLNHDLFYSIFYTTDRGETWVLIAENLTSNEFTWKTYEKISSPTNVSVKVVVTDYAGNRIEIISNEFFIENMFNLNSNQIFELLISLILIVFISIGLFLYLFKRKRSSYSYENIEDVFALSKTKFVRNIYNKLIIGLENCKTSILETPSNLPLTTELEEYYGLANHFPAEYQTDLKTKLKGKTILILIELAYIYPENINPKNLSKILSMPKSSLSDELKKLKDLYYIKTEIDMKTIIDSRFKSYIITQKGYNFLFRLKEILKLSLNKES